MTFGGIRDGPVGTLPDRPGNRDRASSMRPPMSRIACSASKSRRSWRALRALPWGGDKKRRAFPGDAEGRAEGRRERPGGRAGQARREPAAGDGLGRAPEMPKKDKPLSRSRSTAIRRWIEQGRALARGSGAQDRRFDGQAWWAFRAARTADGPRRQDRSWARTPIDAFILAGSKRRACAQPGGRPPHPDPPAHLRPARPAADARGDRRVPRRQCPRRLREAGRSPAGLARVTASAGAGTGSTSSTTATPTATTRTSARDHAWPYRDYVIRSFNDDMPYAPVHPRAGRRRRALAGRSARRDRDRVHRRRARGTSSATSSCARGPSTSSSPAHRPRRHGVEHDVDLLSLTVHCARCHDHKFDPIPQEDYYRLQAVFAGVDRGDRLPTPRQSRAMERLEEQRRGGRRALQAIEQKIDALTSPELVAARRPRSSSAASARRHAPLDSGRLPAPPTATTRRSIPSPTPGVGPGRPGPLGADRRGPPDPGPADRLSRHARLRLPRPLPRRALGRPDFARGGGCRPPRTIARRGTRRGRALRHPRRRPHGAVRPGHGLAALEASERLCLRARRARGHLGRQERRPESAGHRARLDRGGSLGPRHLVDGFDSRQPGRSDRSGWPRHVTTCDTRSRSCSEHRGTAGRRRWSTRRSAPSATAAAPSWRSSTPASRPCRPARWSMPCCRTRRGRSLCCGGATSSSPASPSAPVPGVRARPRLRLRLAHPDDEGSRRAALADWIASPKNVLTWRSIVNRVWHYHFGRGIVDTPNDFGRNGSRPTHPELLDWLAVEFLDERPVAQGVASPDRQSAVYRQSSRDDPAPPPSTPTTASSGG